MRGAWGIAWIQNRVLLAWLALVTVILTWLLAAPVAPMRDGVLRLVTDTPFLKKLVGGVMGLDLTGEVTVKLLVGSTWAHPFLLALIWGYAVVAASRYPTQEVEDHTVDFLMSQPVSRFGVLAAHGLLASLGLAWLVGFALLGFDLGCRNLGSDAPSLLEMIPVATSLFASGLWVLGATTLVAVHSRTRSRVLNTMLAFILWSLVLAYLKPFVPWAGKLSALGLLEYYRPGDILRSAAIPWMTVGGLSGVGLLLWSVGAWKLRSRDL